MATRRAIHAFVTPESHEALHASAGEYGVSVSALLEAMALDWELRRGESAYELDEVEALAAIARQVDARRRRRRKDPPAASTP
ncbi:MAG: hypothetical protein WCK41_03650 [Actinomycetes bacterium]